MSSRLGRPQIEALYAKHASGVRRFLLGVLRSPELAEEALQQCYLRVVESGHEVGADSMRAWIYKVAHNEAMSLRRREGIDARATRAKALDPRSVRFAPAADAEISEREDTQRVVDAGERLPVTQREVVRMRFSEGKTFAEIAAQLEIPIGTALTRARLALEKLRSMLR